MIEVNENSLMLDSLGYWTMVVSINYGIATKSKYVFEFHNHILN